MKFVFSLLFCVSSVSFAANNNTQGDKGGGKTPSCQPSQVSTGKNDNHVTTKKENSVCGTPANGKQGGKHD